MMRWQQFLRFYETNANFESSLSMSSTVLSVFTTSCVKPPSMTYDRAGDLKRDPNRDSNSSGSLLIWPLRLTAVQYYQVGSNPTVYLNCISKRFAETWCRDCKSLQSWACTNPKPRWQGFTKTTCLDSFQTDCTIILLKGIGWIVDPY